MILIYGCAQVVAPSGGEKDITAPIALEKKTQPKNFTTNFNVKEISIEFNEYYNLNNPNQNIIITPSLKEKPEFIIKGKKLLIKLNNELEPNTTYSINFGQAISDITEGNITKNFKYVFSTGTFLDSLKLKGIVNDAFTNKPSTDVSVMLYNSNYDSVPVKEKPFYFTKTDGNGNFEISNIKKGKYKLFVLDDANNNFLYDNSSEDIGFIDSLVAVVNDSLKPLRLQTFNEKKDKFFIKSAELKPNNTIELAFSKRLTFAPEINYANTELNYFKANTDSIVFLLTDTTMSKIEIPVFVQEYEFRDTLTLRRKGFLSKINLLNSTKEISLKDSCKLTFNYFFSSIDSSKIILLKDSTEVKYSIIDFKNNQFVGLPLKLIPGKYTWGFLPGTITSIFNTINDTIFSNFNILENEKYASFVFDIKINPTLNSPIILQLLDNTEKIIASEYLYKSKKITYTYLKPGDYSARIIIDENGDKEWTTGDYYRKIQPEKVILFNKKIALRANWEINETWEVKLPK